MFTLLGMDPTIRLLVEKNLADRLFEPIVKSQAGIYRSSQKLGIDQAYEEKLIELIEGSTLDAVLLLAMDYPYDSEGNNRKDYAKFYVPNDHVLHLAKRYSQIIPACSIHPARKDAIEELERVQIKEPKYSNFSPIVTMWTVQITNIVHFGKNWPNLVFPFLPTLEENSLFQF